MRILLTNDDGITALGIQALCLELADLGEVIVVAPDSEKSASSQAITVHHPIRVDRHGLSNQQICAWRVGGTPTDCVKIALETLLSEQPDIVVSGINHGPNLGTDVLYSGTVSAAIEGALHDIPAIAVSLASWHTLDFIPAARFTRRLVEVMSKRKLPPRTLLNVNVPPLLEAELQGVAITKLGVTNYSNAFERREDPRGRVYYWMGGIPAETDNDPDSDVVAIRSGKISVTPIHFDLTNYSIINLLHDWQL